MDRNRFKRNAAFLLALIMITAAAFNALSSPVYAGTGNKVSSKWHIITASGISATYDTYVTVYTNVWIYFDAAISGGYNLGRNTTTVTCNYGGSASLPNSKNKAPSKGEQWLIGTSYINVTRKTSAYSARFSTSSYHNHTSGGQGTSSTYDDVTIPALPARTVYYNANLTGPSDSSTTAETTGEVTDLFITQDGTIQQNGSDLATTTNGSFDLWDIAGIKKEGYHTEEGAEWNSSADGSGTSYSQSAAYERATFTNGQTLYINWKPDEYNIQYFPNGADSGAMPQQTMYFDRKTYAISNSYVKDGYKLGGWDRDPDADPEGGLDVTGDKGVISNDILTGLERGDTVRLYAIWRELGPSETQIYIGKTKTVEGGGADTEDEFTFRIEPAEAMTTDNESAPENGTAIPVEDIPMPAGTVDEGTADAYKEVTVTGLTGADGLLRTATSGEISFERPGYYMYKVTETAGSSADVVYDRTCYFVTVYVQYLEDTGLRMEVVNTTAWHNRNGMSNYRPDLEDISAVPDTAYDEDRDGVYTDAELSHYSLRPNEEGMYGKTGIGKQGVLVKFWNTEYTEGKTLLPYVNLRIMKNLKGNLGDRTKKFEYAATLTGLTAGATYVIDNDGAELDEGFSGDAVTADADGKATLAFRMRDDESVYIGSLPQNAVVNVTESGSDHVPGCRIYTEDGSVDTVRGALFGGSLSTGNVTMSQADQTYNIVFNNYRELAPVTGMPGRGLPLMALTAVTVCIAVTAAVRRRLRRD